MTTVTIPEVEVLHTPAALGDRLGLSVGALAQMRYRGNGPRFIKLGGRQVRYRESDIQAWLDQQTRDRT
ncbi:helix-turn-helix transcriptional regulator [Glutamicibacter protophormiae]|uniref:helix-turn-helix transcriptional regulator n=1 Tax=Glutamicibacter protophormiae TaxID=37930 RepID=UPI00166C4A80|nr:helix-turn-helix domain-containing protein [Glutamicibacter protophormiae]